MRRRSRAGGNAAAGKRRSKSKTARPRTTAIANAETLARELKESRELLLPRRSFPAKFRLDTRNDAHDFLSKQLDAQDLWIVVSSADTAP